MLKLDHTLELNRAAILAPNLLDRFDKADLDRLGGFAKEGYQHDVYSRMTWMRRNEAGMDLALQVQKDKSFPWAGCANVAFPLITIGAMQFHARAYPAIVPAKDVVKCDTFNIPDPTGQRSARADRISTHMSWQVLHQDKPWEEQEDKAIFNVSIVGTNFKKSYFVNAKGHNVSELVLAKDLVLNYWSKSVEECPRKTHVLRMFRNEVYSKVLTGAYRDVLEEPWYKATPVDNRTTQRIEQDNRQGVMPSQPDEMGSMEWGEQHVDLDLDGDGYYEPYILTFHIESGQPVRLVTRFSEEDITRVTTGTRKGQIVQIRAEEYFTKKTFIPSPDGGIYDIGFGVFLGPLNEAVNSLVNMLLDCGTLQTTGGGFLGRGAKIRGGQYQVAPFEWKRVDSTGDDLRKSIFPLPVNAPSDVLFQLLSLLITYASRVTGTTETTVGENPGQNTPAQTMQTMVEMGQKIYTAVFKRIWRASKEEFRKLYVLNGKYLPADRAFPGGATKADYAGDGEDICPVADPNITSEAMRIQRAITVKGAAATTPGYNKDEVERRFLKAVGEENINTIFPGAAGTPPPEDPKITIAKIKAESDLKLQAAQLQADQQEFVITLMEERELNQAKIVELIAKAREAGANAESEMAYAQVALVNAEISHTKARNEAINKRIEHLITAMKVKSDHAVGMKQAEKSEKAAA